jgi:hypothetical protein
MYNLRLNPTQSPQWPGQLPQMSGYAQVLM